MSRIAGVFSETLLRTLRVKADEIMLDGRIKQQFIPQYEIIKALLSMQTASVNPRLSQRKDSDGRVKRYDLEVMWENACEIEPEDNTNCEFGGTKLSTNAQDYSIDWGQVVNFTISEYDMVDNEFNVAETIAKGMLRADKELVEAYAQYCTAVLEANKGVNQFTGSKGTVVGADTYIQPAYWDSKLIAYFVRVAQLNRFPAFALLSGGNLFEEYFTIMKMMANADGKGDAELFNAVKIFFDLFNIDSVNDPDLVTYMIAQGAVAVANRVYNPPTLEAIGINKRWTMASQFVPELKYDVFYEPECSNDLYDHNFKVKLSADLFVNPEGCEVNNTGILSFVCGTGD